MTHSSELFDDYSRGVSNKDSKCSSCQTHLISKWDRQEIWVMPCEHVFHARCIAKNEGTCTLCFNELDVLSKLEKVFNVFRLVLVSQERKRQGSPRL